MSVIPTPDTETGSVGGTTQIDYGTVICGSHDGCGIAAVAGVAIAGLVVAGFTLPFEPVEETGSIEATP